MSNPSGFAHTIADIERAKVVDHAMLAAWYISETSGVGTSSIEEVIEFLQAWGVRPNINPSRLKKDLRANRDVTLRDGKQIIVPLAKSRELKTRYQEFLSPPKIKVEDRILDTLDFDGHSRYIQELVRQINVCHQVVAFDGCAVMMRRLVEALIILAFNKANLRDEILETSGNYLTLEGLVSSLAKSRVLKLTRSSPSTLAQVKKIGDRAAHSTTYITSEKDIDLISADFRALIADLLSLND